MFPEKNNTQVQVLKNYTQVQYSSKCTLLLSTAAEY